MIDRLLAFLSDPRVPLLALALLPVLRAVYAIISRVVKPYPRARAAVEAVAALFPDLVRAVLQGVSIFTGRPAPKLDIVPVGDPDPRVIAAGARAVDIIAGEWRERALAAESRVAELTASDEPGRLRPTVVPGDPSPPAMATQRHRIATRPRESGRVRMWVVALLVLGGAGCGGTDGATAALATATTAIKVATAVRRHLCARELDLLLGDPRATEAPASSGGSSAPSSPTTPPAPPAPAVPPAPSPSAANDASPGDSADAAAAAGMDGG